MIITCQNCQTHYSVDVSLVGGGKTVRCENCGNSWHQRPKKPQRAVPPPPLAAMAPEPVAPPQPALQQPFEPVPAPAPEPAPEPEPIPETSPEADADAETAAMEDEPAAEEAIVEAEDEGAADTVEDAEDADAASDALSPGQLDEMFGEDTEPDTFDSISGGNGAKDETTDIAELENIPDPEPIPQVFSPDDDDLINDGLEAKGKGKIIAVAALVLVIVLGAGAFFGRSMIVDLWPGAADMYAMISLGGEELGAGLVIEDVESSRQVEGGVDVLVIRGVIANVSEEDHMVPMIRVALFDANGDEVQFAVAAPLKNRLQGGTKIGFSAKLPEPSALGRRVVVTFTEAKKKGS